MLKQSVLLEADCKVKVSTVQYNAIIHNGIVTE